MSSYCVKFAAKTEEKNIFTHPSNLIYVPPIVDYILLSFFICFQFWNEKASRRKRYKKIYTFLKSIFSLYVYICFFLCIVWPIKYISHEKICLTLDDFSHSCLINETWSATKCTVHKWWAWKHLVIAFERKIPMRKVRIHFFLGLCYSAMYIIGRLQNFLFCQLS